MLSGSIELFTHGLTTTFGTGCSKSFSEGTLLGSMNSGSIELFIHELFTHGLTILFGTGGTLLGPNKPFAGWNSGPLDPTGGGD